MLDLDRRATEIGTALQSLEEQYLASRRGLAPPLATNDDEALLNRILALHKARHLYLREKLMIGRQSLVLVSHARNSAADALYALGSHNEAACRQRALGGEGLPSTAESVTTTAARSQSNNGARNTTARAAAVIASHVIQRTIQEGDGEPFILSANEESSEVLGAATTGRSTSVTSQTTTTNRKRIRTHNNDHTSAAAVVPHAPI